MLLKINTSNHYYSTLFKYGTDCCYTTITGSVYTYRYGTVYSTITSTVQVDNSFKFAHRQSRCHSGSITKQKTGSNYGTSSTTRQFPKQCERCRSFCTRYKMQNIIYGKNMVQIIDKNGQPRIGQFTNSVILYQKKPIV